MLVREVKSGPGDFRAEEGKSRHEFSLDSSLVSVSGSKNFKKKKNEEPRLELEVTERVAVQLPATWRWAQGRGLAWICEEKGVRNEPRAW